MAVTNADILGWLNANPGASPELINQTMAEAGVTAAQYQSATGSPPPQVQQVSRLEKVIPAAQAPLEQTRQNSADTYVQEASLFSPQSKELLGLIAPPAKELLGGPVQKAGEIPTTVAAAVSQNPLVDLYQSTLGRTPSQAEIDSWGFGNTIEPYELDRFLGAARNEATSTMPTTGAAANIAKQILAQGTTSQWKGEGYGSAEKTAYDMGVMLAGQGITDINQLGQTKVEVPSVDQDGYPITETVTKFVNKATGQPLETYYDRASSLGSNIWGGTFAGKDSTAYGVQFDAAGKPIFYSQSGGDSSNMADLMPLIQIGLMATGAGGMLGNALLGTGASQVAAGALGGGLLGAGTSALAGGDWKQGALLGGAGGALGGYLQGLDGSLVPSLDAADTAGGLIPKFGTSYDDWMQLVMDNPEAQQALLNAINGTQVAATTPITTPTTAEGLFNVPSADTVNITGASVPTQLSPDIFSAITSPLSNNLTTTTPTVEVTAQNPNKAVVPTVLPITSNLTTTNVVPNVEVTGTADNNKVTTPVVTLPSGTTTTTTAGTNTSTDLTTDQKVNLAKAGLSLVGLLGGGAAAGGLLGGGGTGTVNVGALPTQGVPINSDDYFNAIQRNYNALLPAMPRDVATPLRSWYNSQYGA